MKLKNRFKSRIGIKILCAFLGLAVISLILFGYVVFIEMRGLGEYALKSSTFLGDQVVEDSIKALKDQAEKHLLKSALDQAALSEALLRKVRDEIGIIADFAADIWKRSLPFGSERSYSQSEKPDDIYAHSFYLLAPGLDIDRITEEVGRSGELDRIFIPVLANDRKINSLFIGTESGVFRGYPWMTGIDPSFDPRKRIWYTEAAEKGEAIWTEPYIHAVTKELIVTCAKPFYGPDGKLAGVVEADVTLKVMNENILSGQEGNTGHTFLLDSAGELIARPGLAAGGTKWDEAYVTENFLQSDNRALREIALNMVAGKSGIGRCEFARDEKYIAYAPIADTGWSLGIVMPVEDIIASALLTKDEIISVTEKTDRDIDRRIGNTQNIIICIFICVILVVFLIANKLSKKITRPILLLNNGAKIIGGGNLDYHLEVKTGDEIEDLAGTFNKMTQDLKLYIKNLEKTTAAKERTENELKIAHDIQMNILPKTFPPFPDRPEFDIYAALEPAREVGGDFYDFFFIDDDHLCFVVGDVSGKGVPAALFMAMTKTLIKTITKEAKSPDIVLSKVNKEISHDNFSSMFVTVFCGILNIRTGEVYYTSGGHTPSLVVSGGEKAEFIEGANCAAVGAIGNAVYKKGKLVLQPGDVIFLYTDGITEAVNTDGEMFSEERLKEEVSGCREVSVSALAGEILQKVERFSDGAPQADDITVMVLRYFGDTKKRETGDAKKTKSIVLKNDTSEIGELVDAVAGFGKENNLTDDVIYDLNLALEEIVVNIISHGYEDKDEHQIIIYMELKDDEVVLRVEDDGRPFDPMEIPEVDIEQPIEEREAGGLGIHLVRNLMDKVRYRREGGRNVLMMGKTPVFRS